MNNLLDTAILAARSAGEVLRRGYGTTFKISNKEGKNNLVTEYDHKSEKLIIDLIKERHPDHVFLAEESGGKSESAPDNVRWVIDPLDGTVNFAHGIPIFSVSIAAEKNGQLLCGVIYHPILDELFSAEPGKGAFLNGEPIHVSDNEEFERSILVTGFPYNVNQNPCNCIDHFVEVIQNGIPIRRLGSAALDLAYVASGRFDGFWEIDLKPWDVAAGVLILREAGGLVTQYDKSEYKLSDRSILATNGKIHNQLSQRLTRCDCNKVETGL